MYIFISLTLRIVTMHSLLSIASSGRVRLLEASRGADQETDGGALEETHHGQARRVHWKGTELLVCPFRT